MVVGGPSGKDLPFPMRGGVFLINWKVDITLEKLIEKMAKPKDIEIKEGKLFLLPCEKFPFIRHAPSNHRIK